MKQKEVTNFAKGGNFIASHCKIGYFPHRIFDIFLFEIKILLYKFLEHLPNIHDIPVYIFISFINMVTIYDKIHK